MGGLLSGQVEGLGSCDHAARNPEYMFVAPTLHLLKIHNKGTHQ